MSLGLEEVSCFQAVMDLGSINSASSKLNKAKSAVSYSINKLEEELGFSLFRRGSYRLEPTRRGQEFYDRSLRLIHEAQRLETLAKQMKTGVELSLGVSCSELYSLCSFNMVLKAVLNEFKDTEIRYQRELMSGEELLSSGVVDIAVFGVPVKDDKFEYKYIKTVKLYRVISSEHPFLNLEAKDQTMEKLVSYPQIVQRSTIPSAVMAGVHEDSVKWYVTGTATKREMIADGLGWGRLPEHEVEDLRAQSKLTHLAHLDEDVAVDMYLVRLKKSNHGKVNQFLWDQF